MYAKCLGGIIVGTFVPVLIGLAAFPGSSAGKTSSQVATSQTNTADPASADSQRSGRADEPAELEARLRDLEAQIAELERALQQTKATIARLRGAPARLNVITSFHMDGATGLGLFHPRPSPEAERELRVYRLPVPKAKKLAVLLIEQPDDLRLTYSNGAVEVIAPRNIHEQLAHIVRYLLKDDARPSAQPRRAQGYGTKLPTLDEGDQPVYSYGSSLPNLDHTRQGDHVATASESLATVAVRAIAP